LLVIVITFLEVLWDICLILSNFSLLHVSLEIHWFITINSAAVLADRTWISYENQIEKESNVTKSKHRIDATGRAFFQMS